MGPTATVLGPQLMSLLPLQSFLQSDFEKTKKVLKLIKKLVILIALQNRRYRYLAFLYQARLREGGGGA